MSMNNAPKSTRYVQKNVYLQKTKTTTPRHGGYLSFAKQTNKFAHASSPRSHNLYQERYVLYMC